ncbi:HCL510Wp [Eremothecium sinecaudum]|uniref:HCL510Wp n=1 Tax=Eremothecium sinecaudum TaxID=45286 RepID=A0A109UW44_9SACH|nr:HCL510Wp [Eremothecium sinecaudum]AMD19641.1 HCL510Wp [Eremothecium sinecaudum]
MVDTTKYYAKFVHNHVQKSSLTFTTSPVVSKALSQFYPLLIVVDSVLNNLMWIQEDTSLGFIYLLLLCLSVKILEPSVDRSLWFYNWVAFVSLSFLVCSVIYNIHSTIRDMKKDEAPTVDDIMIVLESVIDKLDRMRIEIVGVGLRKRLVANSWAITKLMLVLMPFHWIILKMLSPINYLMMFLALAATYHSAWFQSTLKLCWRSLHVRMLYYKLWSYDPSNAWCTKPVQYEVLSEEHIPFPKVPENLTGAKLQLHVQNALTEEDISWSDRELSPDMNYARVEVVQFHISENERKWPVDGWTGTMLPYERQHYSLTLDPLHRDSPSPWKLQEELSPEWWWMDDNWTKSAWKYTDSEWNYLGDSDSVGCYNRWREWKRKAFKIIEKGNI